MSQEFNIVPAGFTIGGIAGNVAGAEPTLSQMNDTGAAMEAMASVSSGMQEAGLDNGAASGIPNLGSQNGISLG